MRLNGGRFATSEKNINTITDKQNSFITTDRNINEPSFAKLLVAQPLDPRQTFKNSNPFALAKAISSVAKGTLNNVTTLSNDFLLFDCNSVTQNYFKQVSQFYTFQLYQWCYMI